MAQNNNYIVFQCYGSEGIFHECAYALLSLSRFYTAEELSNVQIWIYTDNPAYFSAFKNCWLPLHFRALDDGILAKWRGAINFVHRVKIEVLQEFTREHAGNILYLDTDILFTNRIDRMWDGICNGKLYMHVMEGVISGRANPIFEKLDDYLKQSGQNELRNMAMWNAGVLGFNMQFSGLLEEILNFTDKEYAAFPKHIWEQFAFSVYFQKEGKLEEAAPYILHYWNVKEARVVLGSFFAHFKDSTWDELASYAQMVDIPALIEEKSHFLQKRSILDRLLKKAWVPAMPDWDRLKK
jgi:hypothetical protein